jgi:hypothetical protein
VSKRRPDRGRQRRPQWRKLRPGVYVDDLGNMEIDAPAYLRAHGIPVTEANKDTLEAVARQLCRERGMGFGSTSSSS